MKIKTLIIIGLTAFLCLSGATAHAQSDKQIINMDNPDYDIDVERFCSPYIDFDNPKETRKEVNYRYVKYTKDMYVSRTEKYPILIYYISMDSLATKKATFCDTDFVKRISRRLGLTKNEDPEKIEMDLMKELPKDHWILYNIQIITFGRSICTARSPKCEQCFLQKYCKEFKM